MPLRSALQRLLSTPRDVAGLSDSVSYGAVDFAILGPRECLTTEHPAGPCVQETDINEAAIVASTPEGAQHASDGGRGLPRQGPKQGPASQTLSFRQAFAGFCRLGELTWASDEVAIYE